MDARRAIKRIGWAILIAAGMSAAADGQAASVTVRCGGGGEDAFPSISAALAHLDARATNTIAVYGACQENLSITDFNHLTLNANAGASISDASRATNNVILITSSQTVTLNGFTINGAVLCQVSSFCRFTGNTFQNARGGIGPQGGASLSDGVYIRAASHASFSGDKMVNNSRFGMTVTGGSFAEATAITVSGNAVAGMFLAVGPTVLLNNVTIANNGYFGIYVRDHSTLFITDSEVTGNGGTGVSLESGSEAFLSATVTGNVITGNGNYGVLIADLSLANSDGVTGNSISGNSAQPDVQCVGKSSAAVGLPLRAGTISATCGP
jgi:hypothetical protein